MHEPLLNEYSQPIGPTLSGWIPPPFPPHATLEGSFCRLEPLDARAHGEALFAAHAEAPDGRSWTYLPYGPFATRESYLAWLEGAAQGPDPQFYAIVEPKTGAPVGVASYLRITPEAGVIEVGHLNYSPRLQRSPAATEAMFLMMQRAFALGYRRYEWKCDALNAPSRAAALRLGFTFEGIFRQATIYKGRSRDTAWYSIIDRDWPALQALFRRWLHPDNFDPEGHQRLRLSDLTANLTDAG